MILPLGFKKKEKKRKNEDKVYKLEITIYRLCQVLKAWYGKIDNYLWDQNL